MSNIKIKAEFKYDSIEFTVVGLVNKEDFEDAEEFGLGFIENGDMMTDGEGYNMHTVLEGHKELEAYSLISNGDTGSVECTLIK